MEGGGHPHLLDQYSPEALPTLIRIITANEVDGFDGVKGQQNLRSHSPTVSFNFCAMETGRAAILSQIAHSQSERMQSVSISMPSSPGKDHDGTVYDPTNPMPAPLGVQQATFHSQPMTAGGKFLNSTEIPPRNQKVDRMKDKRFDSFKTWSGRLERQKSNLRGKPRETGPEENTMQNEEVEILPVDRYFDALEGPELDTLRASEEILLPEDEQWPFLLRFPISSFGICLGISSQSIMWKTLATSASTKFLHVSLDVNLILWYISVALVACVIVTYMLKVLLYFEAVRREYYHPIRVNFFFAPWITLLFLALGVPPSITENLNGALWYVLMTPIFCLELKIYGQWMSGGQRRLSKVANPSNYLSIVGNFVGALLGASMGLKEGPIFFFAVGLAHYTVLFVTLYQRLPTNETLPKELHPVFFLFVAPCSVASIAWANIQGSFDYGARIAYFIALFLYFSLAVRVNFFRGFKFSLAWWAYTFPMTGAAIATIRFSNEVPNIVTKFLSVALSGLAMLAVASVLVTSILHAFVLRDLFPNDIAIAISERRPKTNHRKWFHRGIGSSEKDIQIFLKYADAANKDVEAPTTKPVEDSPTTGVPGKQSPSDPSY
ncbi:hypothetical protein NMG60_11020240 [Bertholletia excelsa]